MATQLLEDSDLALLLDIANMACHEGFPQEARTIVDGVLSAKPNFVPALITKAYSHLIVDDFTTALEILDPILAANQEDYDARLMQGLTFLLAQRTNEGKEAFAKIPADAHQHKLAEELAKAF
ncbi:MAG: tetratricopeptide repeat protein [Desulfovibrionaceae bacterium]|nr:tetratricopeptide repeat protein [Desulfovibrionaceae bacterium]